MRGNGQRPGGLFSYVDLEKRVRADHPLRAIRELAGPGGVVGGVRRPLRGRGTTFGGAGEAAAGVLLDPVGATADGAAGVRPVVRWFVGQGIDDPVWDHSTFSKNRDRLLEGDVAARFLDAVLAQPRVRRLLSSEHFSVDGTDRGMGVDEERPAEGSGACGIRRRRRRARRGRRRAQRAGGFPR